MTSKNIQRLAVIGLTLFYIGVAVSLGFIEAFVFVSFWIAIGAIAVFVVSLLLLLILYLDYLFSNNDYGSFDDYLNGVYNG